MCRCVSCLIRGPWITSLVPKMVGQFGIDGALHDPLREIGEDAIGSQEFKPLSIDSIHHVVESSVVHQRM